MHTTVTMETAVLLKKLKYNVPTGKYFKDGNQNEIRGLMSNWNRIKGFTSLPQIHDVVRWLREVKHVHIVVYSDTRLRQWRAGLQIQHVTQVVELSDESWSTHDAAVEEIIKLYLQDKQPNT